MDIVEEIQKIKLRNKKVEADKAWETSLFRKLLVSILTYIVTAAVFYLIGVNNYYLSALIPTLGYFLSVQTIPYARDWWIKKYEKERKFE